MRKYGSFKTMCIVDFLTCRWIPFFLADAQGNSAVV